MAAWTLRRAEVADVEGLAACLAAAYGDTAARIPDLPDVTWGVAEDIAAGQVWVAEAGGAVVGALVLYPRDGFMVVANVGVHPERQGTGLGRALLAHAEAEARDQGFREMRLTTHAAMADNVAMYTRAGWTEAGRAGNTVSMRKAL